MKKARWLYYISAFDKKWYGSVNQVSVSLQANSEKEAMDEVRSLITRENYQITSVIRNG